MQKESYGIWPNQGQITDLQGNPVPDVSFYTTGSLPRAYFRKDGSFSLVLASVDTTTMADTLRRLDITCVGPEANYPDPIVWEMKQRYANFYFPQCAPNGATNVHAYARVIYPEMYPLIDMQIYSGRMGQKLAFVVNPGGDPKDIELQLTGQDQLDVDIYGNLKILLDGKWVVLPEAVAYQVESNNDITPVNWTADYEVNNGQATVRFNFDQFDHGKPLVFLIGPAAMGGTPSYSEEGICWSTYYGGDERDYTKDAKADLAGGYYVGGRTYSTFASFPNLPGAINIIGATAVATLTKFNEGNELQWTNYFGGLVSVDNFTHPTTGEVVAVKEVPYRAIYLAGTSKAPNLLIQPEAGAYSEPGTGNLSDKGFIAKFDEFGQILWSTYFGDHDVEIEGMDVLTQNRIIVSGHSPNILPVPPEPLAGATVLPYAGGSSDGFLALFDINDQLSWRTYYGGSDNEDGVLVKTCSEWIYLAGNTLSSDIPPIEPQDCYHQTYQGGQDCMIAAFTIGGTPVWATYLGGDGEEVLGPKGLATNKDNEAMMVGTTQGLDDLVFNPDHWYDDTPSSTEKNGFITRFSGEGHFTPLWISYLGSGHYHFPWCLSIDAYGSMTVGGYTNDPFFEAVPRAGYYYQPNYLPDGIDGFITQFDEQQDRVWSTLFGGKTGGVINEHIPENIMSLNDLNGSLYATGYTEKHNQLVNSYFPLDNQQSTAWFNDVFNGNGLSNEFSDGFIAQFCNELSIGIEPVSSFANEGLQLISQASGNIIIAGLADGPHTLRIFDALGRLLLDRSVRSTTGRTGTVELGERSNAMYIIQVDGTRTTKYIPVQ